MNYKETLDFLFSQLPMFQRIGPAAYKTDLTNTVEICKRLGNPQEEMNFIHVAGTNGKGSVSHFLAAILQQAGYRTGLYTSPHLKDFRERIRIDGKMIPEREVIDFVDKYRDRLYDIHPSFFEYTVGMAFEYFFKEKVDITVLEVGMGGRLDSTNIVTPVISVITGIGKDHMAFLGDTLEKIALEKAGIIKTRIPVVIGNHQPETAGVFSSVASERNAPISFANRRFIPAGEKKPEKDGKLSMQFTDTGTSRLMTLVSGLPGHYQEKNLPAVLETCRLLNVSGFRVSDDDILEGISNVKTLTGITGRWQQLRESPRVICDIGHNEDGIRAVVEQIASVPHRKLHFVFGTVDDKDPRNLLELLPKDAVYYFCRAGIPRAMEQEKLRMMAEKAGLAGRAYESVKEAYEAAVGAASPDDLVFVGGSTFVVAEVV